MVPNYNLEYKDSENPRSLQDESSHQELFEVNHLQELAQFAGIIRNGFQMAMQELSRHPPHYQLPSTKAHETARFIVGQLLDNYPEYMHKEGLRYFLQKDGARFYFKKLKKSFFPMNNPTRTSNRILQQLPLFPDMYNYKVTEIFVGYHLNKSKDDIAGCYAVYISDGEVRWVSNIDNLAVPGTKQFNPNPISIELDDDDMLVKTKVGQKKNSAS